MVMQSIQEKYHFFLNTLLASSFAHEANIFDRAALIKGQAIAIIFFKNGCFIPVRPIFPSRISLIFGRNYKPERVFRKFYTKPSKTDSPNLSSQNERPQSEHRSEFQKRGNENANRRPQSRENRPNAKRAKEPDQAQRMPKEPKQMGLDFLRKQLGKQDAPSPENPYSCLGLTPNASNEEAQKAFRKLAVKLHPDKHAGTEEEKAALEAFKIVEEANARIQEKNNR